MLPPTQRLPELERLIDQRSYFVVHAPRQTGKSTAMMALAQQLTQSGRYTAVTLSVEVGNPFNAYPEQVERTILDAWLDTADVFCQRRSYPRSTGHKQNQDDASATPYDNGRKPHHVLWSCATLPKPRLPPSMLNILQILGKALHGTT